MRIAFIGDIVGRPGREMLKTYLKIIKEEYNIDFVKKALEMRLIPLFLHAQLHI